MNEAQRLVELIPRLRRYARALVGDRHAADDLVQALGHCGECHTPRNFLGATKKDRFLAGAKDIAPNLTPTRLKASSDDALRSFLTTGLTADGDVPSKEMGEVIANTTSQLTPADLNAMIAYLRSLPPLPEDKK